VLAATLPPRLSSSLKKTGPAATTAAMAVQRFSVLSLPILGVILNRAKSSAVADHTGGQRALRKCLR